MRRYGEESVWVTSDDPRARRDGVTLIHVCVTCRVEAGEEPRAGARLFRSIEAALSDDASMRVMPVECLSVCKRPCTVSFAANGKWTYVYGDLLPDASTAVLCEAAKLYADTIDGLIPWRLRPEAIKKGVVARIPPPPPFMKDSTL